MATGGSGKGNNGDIRDISKHLANVHLDAMDTDDNYVPNFVPTNPTDQQQLVLAQQQQQASVVTQQQQQQQHQQQQAAQQQQLLASQQQQGMAALQQLNPVTPLQQQQLVPGMQAHSTPPQPAVNQQQQLTANQQNVSVQQQQHLSAEQQQQLLSIHQQLQQLSRAQGQISGTQDVAAPTSSQIIAPQGGIQQQQPAAALPPSQSTMLIFDVQQQQALAGRLAMAQSAMSLLDVHQQQPAAALPALSQPSQQPAFPPLQQMPGSLSSSNRSSASSTASSSSAASGSSGATWSSVSAGSIPSRDNLHQFLGRPDDLTTFNALQNQFLSDPRFMSSYVEATFTPCATPPGEVVILIPNLFDPGQTLPVNVHKNQLLNFYLQMFGDPSSPFYQGPAISYDVPDWRRSQQRIPTQWLDFMQNPPNVPDAQIPAPSNANVVQQGGLDAGVAVMGQSGTPSQMLNPKGNDGTSRFPTPQKLLIMQQQQAQGNVQASGVQPNPGQQLPAYMMLAQLQTYIMQQCSRLHFTVKPDKEGPAGGAGR